MSSWSSYPPPSRRSRSRTPPRGGYPAGRPYNEPYGEGYRDYEYERDRWAYERDRDRIYDYGRRGRSRSPPLDEPGRKRRRSMSPYDRERYDPRPRHGEFDDAPSRYGYSTSPRRYSSSYAPSRRAPPDPHTFEFPASLKQYAEWFRYFYPTQAAEEDSADKTAEQEAGDGSKPRNGIRSRWEKYKKEFSANQLQTMFEHHKKSPWFAEKYDPAQEYEKIRLRVRKAGWKGRVHTFLHDLESGKFDPDFVEPEPETAKENGEGTHPEGNGVGQDDAKVEDDMQFTTEHDDDTEANGKSGEKRGSGLEEEVSVPTEGNQVMIRTIPPDIGRVKLEDYLSKISGFVHLALGDPLQKRNFYRAGWIKFEDNADMGFVMTELSEKKIEGFKLHVTHNTRPFTNKVRYAPEVANRPERLEKDLENVKILATLLEEQAAKLRAYKHVAPEKTNDESSAEEPVDVPILEVEEEEEEPKERGSDAVERRIEKVLADMKDQGLVDVNDEKAYQAKKVVVSLDMYLAYLRAAFHTCYYCAVVTDHLEELQRKCVKHHRKPLSKLLLDEIKAAEVEKDKTENVQKEEDQPMVVDGDSEDKKTKEKEKDTKKIESRDWKRNDERWLEWLDSKAALLINREGVDPRDYGGKSYEEELTKAVEQHIKQEDEGKFRCKTCQKLFKATSFVEKHIANKHPELVKQLDEQLPYFNNFALDPHRIQPFAHPPPVVGNSNQPPPQAFGIQAPVYHPNDHGRGASYYGGAAYPPPATYPPYNNGYWDGGPDRYGAGYPPAVARRDDGRRLSERIGGYAPGETAALPMGVGLPPKPSPAALDSALTSGSGAKRSSRSGSQSTGAPPPPPPDAKEDPRAAAGKRVSYHDMDLVAEGDVELMY
ncbi:hypothetical protein CPB83DRAFT_858152 [Crepidotus variabilis]|uniref:C2H2-type domain-containing protein n=1 Tax=Crepidotus variabilis TaxID=179855 RepID=A0A9P6EBZ8_9AGAR|nr:hypothetical protein CPB83DRAFT_858152 [Crepidotus variabilis]